MDAYVKTVLTVIAACLLLQVGQGFGLGGTPGPGQTGSISPEETNRYLLQPIPVARLLLRMDRVTGQTWTTPLQQEEGGLWWPIDELPPEPLVGEEGEGDLPQPGDARK